MGALHLGPVFQVYSRVCRTLLTLPHRSNLLQSPLSHRPRNMASTAYELDPTLLEPGGATDARGFSKLGKFPRPQPSSPLGIAAATGDVGRFADATADDLNRREEASRNTPLIWAADAGQAEVVQAIASRPAVDLNARGYLGSTALSRACRRGHADIVRHLLSLDGLDPNIPNGKLQYPLHFAAFQGHAAVVAAMIESGKCDLAVKDRKGRTPAEDTKHQAIQAMLGTAMQRSESTRG